MNGQDRTVPAPSTEKPSTSQPSKSGEGASSALEALIRKRRQAEGPPEDASPPTKPLAE